MAPSHHKYWKLFAVLLVVATVILSTACTGKKSAEATKTEATGPVPMDSETELEETAAPEVTETEAETTEVETTAAETTAAATAVTESEDAATTTGAEEPEVYWVFESTSLENEKITHTKLADYKVTLVNVWATYCPPCLEEMPYLAQAAREYADKEVGFMGIVSDISENEPDQALLDIANQMISDAGIEFTNILASDSIIHSILAGVQAVPTTFFMDSKGNLIGKVIVGSMTLEQMREHIELALAEVAQP
ncbi:MAG: TlpA family protein disulfide reductase [Clostridiaceae bacterium]|jgi:thiol-disulfide isomerase/thioredoxin|nr:TlpA family protein disulfide reductase [Clostridiaceae bacterium]